MYKFKKKKFLSNDFQRINTLRIKKKESKIRYIQENIFIHYENFNSIHEKIQYDDLEIIYLNIMIVVLTIL